MSASVAAKSNLQVSKNHVLQLYRALLKAGNRFVDYNYREYTFRVVKEDFRKSKDETDPAKILQLYQKGIDQLGVVTRQSFISMMYAHKMNIMDPLVSKSDMVHTERMRPFEDKDEEDEENARI